MSTLIEAAQQALELLERVMSHGQAVQEAKNILCRAIEQAQQAEPVAELTDDEIYDAAYATFCRGPNTRELFRMMWMCNPPCSIGWDRNELKAFARHIASLYTSPPPRQPWVGLTDEEISSIAFKAGDEESAIHLAMNLLKEKNT
jgi:hypothetical protein